MTFLLLLYVLYPHLVDAESCGRDAYFGPTGRCEPCGNLCDRPAEYPGSCKRRCPNYIARDRLTHLTTTPVPSTSSVQNSVTSENCGNETYFGPTGRCEPCGDLCDNPAEYPVSCRGRCPNYVAKDRPISTTSSALSSRSSAPWLIGAFSGIGVMIIISLLLIQIWKKLLKPFLAQLAEQRNRRKLRLPTQVQNNHTGNYEMVPLNQPEIIGNFSGDSLYSIENMENTHLAEGNVMICTSDSVVTISDNHADNSDSQADNSDEDSFDFGDTFPFHSLTTLKSVF